MDEKEVLELVIRPALTLLPERMRSRDAERMLVAIGLQESGFAGRVQRSGPAKGFWQFERTGGVQGVLEHHATADLAAHLCVRLRYNADSVLIYQALEHNDLLAAIFARLLLWQVPAPLPGPDDIQESWRQYADDSWRPGKPHRDRWDDSWGRACRAVV